MHKKKTWRGDVAALSMVKMVPKSMKEPKAEEEFDVVCVCVCFSVKKDSVNFPQKIANIFARVQQWRC